MPRDRMGLPFVPPSMPNCDDEELGFSFFREAVSLSEYRELSLPRTFFGRSLLQRVVFAGTDLSESRMCWNDFEECDFTGADLSRSDLRASNFKRCKFTDANLQNADLRQSHFEDCDFTNANLAEAIAHQPMLQKTGLPRDARFGIKWAKDPGSLPPGG